MPRLTEKQKRDLEAIGKHAENFKVRSSVIGEPVANIDNRITTVYEGLKEHLFWIDEYFPVFERRILTDKKHDVKGLLLSINRKIRKASKKKER